MSSVKCKIEDYIFDFEKLEVYKKALNFANELFRVLRDCPKDIQFIFGEHLCRTGIQILNNIAEGSGKNTKKAKAQFYNYSLDSGRECIPMITVLLNQKAIDQNTHDFLRVECIGICRMLAKLVDSIKVK